MITVELSSLFISVNFESFNISSARQTIKILHVMT